MMTKYQPGASGHHGISGGSATSWSRSRLVDGLFTEGVEGWMEQKVAKSAKPGKGFAWYALAIFACFCLMIHVVLKCWPKRSLSCSAGGVAVEIGSTGTRNARKISRH